LSDTTAAPTQTTLHPSKYVLYKTENLTQEQQLKLEASKFAPAWGMHSIKEELREYLKVVQSWASETFDWLASAKRFRKKYWHNHPLVWWCLVTLNKALLMVLWN